MLSIIVIPLCILWAFLHGRYLRVKSDVPQMLMSDPRQCCAFFKRISRPATGYNLPPLKEGDHL